MVGVAADGSRDEMVTFVERYGVDEFVHLDDSDRTIRDEYAVFTQPMFAFIDGDGSVRISLAYIDTLADTVAALAER